MALCDLNSEKAWWEWISKAINGVLDKQEELLSHMRSIATAPTVREDGRNHMWFWTRCSTESPIFSSWFSQENKTSERTGNFYGWREIKVQFEDSTYPHCNCSEWRPSRLPCKHFCLIFSCIPGWGWEKVTSMYRKSPLLNLDDMALNVTTTENQMPTDDMRRHHQIPCFLFCILTL